MTASTLPSRIAFATTDSASSALGRPSFSATSASEILEYAVFMRRPVTYAGRLAVAWLQSMCAHRKAEVTIDEPHAEGAWVGSGEVLCFLRGPLSALADLETIFLQRLGASCVAAYNAYNMCVELPGVAFLAME